MGFISIENYDGEKGYVPGNPISFDVVEMRGIKYLAHFSELLNPERKTYRIINEGEDTAVVVGIKDNEVLDELGERHKKMLEEISDDAIF
ncbi:hypothetical protein HOE04_03625 [archaeon]|jgi:hypothetical protein|nr:hypothetical protein [archaeon]